jgi:hypothetical protein
MLGLTSFWLARLSSYEKTSGFSVVAYVVMRERERERGWGWVGIGIGIGLV